VILLWFCYILLWFSIRFRESWGSYLSQNRIHIVSKQYQNHIKTTYFSSKPKHEKMIVPCILLWFYMISIRFRRGSAHPRLAKRQENRSSKTQHPKAFILWPSDAIRIGAQPWHFMAFHKLLMTLHEAMTLRYFEPFHWTSPLAPVGRGHL
jgi:hypothetical protein